MRIAGMPAAVIAEFFSMTREAQDQWVLGYEQAFSIGQPSSEDPSYLRGFSVGYQAGEINTVSSPSRKGVAI